MNELTIILDVYLATLCLTHTKHVSYQHRLGGETEKQVDNRELCVCIRQKRETTDTYSYH
jgi:hypothetical protein